MEIWAEVFFKITRCSFTPQFENRQVRKVYFFMSKLDENYNCETRFSCTKRLGTESTDRDRVYIHAYEEEDSRGKVA